MYVGYLAFWGVCVICFFWLMGHSSTLRWYVALVCAANVLISIFWGGIDKLVIFRNPDYLGADVHVQQVADDEKDVGKGGELCKGLAAEQICKGLVASEGHLEAPCTTADGYPLLCKDGVGLGIGEMQAEQTVSAQ